MHRLIDAAIARPKSTILAWLVATVLLLPALARIRLDTDPRHVFDRGAPVLADDERMRGMFKLYDFVAVAVVTERGAFNPDTLNRFFHASREIKQVPGVMPLDVFSPENVEDIQQAAGDIATTPVSIVKLQREEIKDQAEADAILARIRANPVLKGKLASDDGKVLTIFVAYDPAEAKSADLAGWLPSSLEELRAKLIPAGPGRRVAAEVERICRHYAAPDEQVYVTGLPVDAESLGTEMARAIAILAPAMLLLTWLLAWAFLRRPRLALAPAVVAAISCVWGLAALALSSFAIQPLSSLAPLLLIPLAAAGPFGLIAEATGAAGPTSADRARAAGRGLARPLLAAAIVQASASATLLLLPVPQLRAAGALLAAGSLVAGALALTFVPAWLSLVRELPPARVAPAGHAALARVAGRRPRAALLAVTAACVLAGLGAFRLGLRDDATRWLRRSQAARRAEDRFDAETSGVQFDYLTIEGTEDDGMKDPALLRYLESVQRELEKSPIVRATTGLPDVVKKIRYELFNDPAKNVLPTRRDESAQMLFVYEISGGNPDKLFHLVTPDYSKAAIWIQMDSQDQTAVREVSDRFDRFVAANPLPAGLVVHWTGVPLLTAWSEAGMARRACAAGLLAVGAAILLVLAAFRSLRIAAAALLPAALALAVVYGVLGWTGAGFDMTAALLFPPVLALGVGHSVRWIGEGGALRPTGGADALLALAFLPMLVSGMTAAAVLAVACVAAVAIVHAITQLAAPAFARNTGAS